jgi:hypothetical protein
MADYAMPVALLDWKPMARNSLRGFAAVRLGKSLKICDIAVHCAHGKRWAQMPGKPQVDKDGLVRRNNDGKIQYTPILSWLDKETADRFSEGVIQAVEAAHPGATEADQTR